MDSNSLIKNSHKLSTDQLIDAAVKNKEGVIASNGAFSTTTGDRSSRSPNDRFIVKEAHSEDLIDWGEVNPFGEFGNFTTGDF